MAEVAHFHAGEGEPLVLLHGFANSWHVWRPVLPALCERHEVLALTLPGHLDADPLEDGVEPTMDALLEALTRRLDAAGIETAHLAGNSLGAWLALDLARAGRARSVVAIAPAGGWTQGTLAERRLRVMFALNHKLTGGLEPYAERLVTRPGLRRLLFAQAMEHPERMRPDDAARWVRATLGCTVYLDLMAAIMRDGPPRWLGEVEAPVLVAWPERDRVVPSKRYSDPFRSLPSHEWRSLPGVGHVPMHDDPDLIASTILDWTARHAGEPVSAGAATAGDP
jgi:pimeloyl-ACP methyl ester carboxylesterase